MKKMMKKGIALAIACCMVILTACGQKNGADSKKNNADREKGKYVQSDYLIPEGESYVHGVKKLKDGILQIVCEMGVYKSSDEGASWEKDDKMTEALLSYSDEENQEYVNGASISEDGTVYLNKLKMVMNEEDGDKNEEDKGDDNEEDSSVQVFGGSEEMDFEYDQSFHKINPDGSKSDLDIEIPESNSGFSMGNMVDKMKLGAEDNLFVQDYSGNIHIINPDNGEIISTISSVEEYSNISGFEQIGDKLVLLTDSGIEIYDIKSGAIQENDKAIDEFFVQDDSLDGSYTGLSNSILKADESGKGFYYADETGLYHYTFGDSEVEQIINGSGTYMEDGNYYFQDMAVDEENETFLILYYSFSMSGEAGCVAAHYEFDAEAALKAEKELNIYSLYDDQNLRQAIASFKSANPEYDINLEIGTTDGDGMTASDAINTLNTNIMAGKGPDIIMLDGMPIASYTEKGLLADLTGIADEASAEFNLLEKIVYSNQQKDGLYAIPTRYTVPVITAPKDVLDSLNDLDSIADAVADLRSGNSDIDSIIGQWSASQIATLLLSTSSSAFMKEDGTVDQEKVEAYFTQFKKICDSNGMSDDEDMEGVDITGIGSSSFGMLQGTQKISIAELGYLLDLNIVLSMNKEKDTEYKLMPGMAEGVFVPKLTAGISSKTEDMEGSSAFIKHLLSEDVQKNEQSSGFPVNTDAYQAMYEYLLENADQMSSAMFYEEEDENGKIKQQLFEITNGTEEEYSRFKEYMQQLDTPAVTNEIILEAILSEAGNVADGTKTPAEAAESVMQTINIYLSE